MSLKIIKKDDPISVDHLVIAIYSNPGLGKTTLGFSAHDPVLLDFDAGAHRSANRQDSVPVAAWPDVTNITEDDLKPYKTVVVDTAGRALDFLTADIIKRNPKMGRGGALTLQGYGQLKSEFTAWLKNLKTMGKDVVLVAHSSEDKSGDDIIERLDIQGGSKNEIYKSSDAMGRLSLENKKRILNFSPTDTSFGKNPGNLDPLTVPDIATEPTFLGGVINTIKDKLNALTEEQAKRQEEIADWIALFDEASTAEDFNKLKEKVVNIKSGIVTTVKSALHNRATAAGLVFENGAYKAEVTPEASE